MPPRRHAYEYDHVNQRCEPYRESGKEQALVAVAEHGGEVFGVLEVAQRGDESEEQEQCEVEDEEDGGDYVEPVGVVWNLVDYD